MSDVLTKDERDRLRLRTHTDSDTLFHLQCALNTIDAVERAYNGLAENQIDIARAVGYEPGSDAYEIFVRVRHMVADRTALMEVVMAARKAIQLAKSPSTGGHSDYRDGYDHAWREVLDLLAGPVDALPDHLKDETKE